MAWLSGYSKRKELVLTGGASGALSDFQLSIAVSYEAAMQGDFDDLRFTQSNGTTLIDAWLETKTDNTSATVWSEFPTTPANAVEQTYYMYYGNGAAASDWDGAATFLQYHGIETSSFIESIIALESSYVYECYGGVTSDTGYTDWGLATAQDRPNDTILIESYQAGNARYIFTQNDSSSTSKNEAPSFTNGTKYKLRCELISGSLYGYVDDDQIGTGAITTNLPDANMGIFMKVWSGTSRQDWSFTRKYAANPPTYAFGSEESAPTGVAPTAVFYGPLFGPFRGPI